ncbi:MAG TPA: protein kinase [bacterium]|nr:protein kinase [bacterium]
MIGKSVSHYRILEKLGEGGMGVVYKAEDTKLKRIVALKFLPPDLTRDPEAKERFIQEAQTASALDHPNICTIHEIDETEGQTFIAMACVEGQSLKDRIATGPLKLENAVAIAIQVAEGLEEAHAKGIVHRDIKSANVMVTPKGQAKIMDFGLAKLLGRTKITRPGTALGTVAYMSPEQARGEEVDHRSDIWSLGVILYEMVSGRLPFRGDREIAIVNAILNDQAEPLTGLRTGVPMELERIVTKAMAKEAGERYLHAGDMLVDLRALRRQLESGPTAAHISVQAPGRKSIAVLPLMSLSPSKDDEYFSDGITEDIITQLSRIGDLRVISRTSVMLYKDSKKNLREIGRELGVATILEGSVRRAGERVRIVAQLVDAGTDEHLWAETYDRDMKDIFAIQSDVAEKIASALRAKLSPSEKERLGKKPTGNIEAYDYYLRGRDYYSRYKKQDNEVAIGLFKKALELDPDYPLAWAGLADAYSQRARRYGMPASWLDAAIEAAEKAIAVDRNCAEAHKALGLAYGGKGFVDRALAAYEKAIEIDPNHAPAVFNAASTYAAIGEFDKAVPRLRRTLTLESLDAFTYAFLGDTYRLLGDFSRAEEFFEKMSEVQPDLDEGCCLKALFLIAQGGHSRAKELMASLVTAHPDNPVVLRTAGAVVALTGDLATAKQYYERAVEFGPAGVTDWYMSGGGGLGLILAREGKRNEAQRLLSRAEAALEKAVENGNAFPSVRYELAGICATKGKKTEAYAWLRKAIEAGWRDYQIGLIDPWLESLRSDDQFQQMMDGVKAMTKDMRRRVEAL